MSLIGRLRQGVTWSDGTRIGAVVGEVNDPVMTEAADRLEAMQAEIDRLNAEIARLRNIANEEGLRDPELAKMAGKPVDVLEMSAKEGKRKFRASLGQGEA